MIRRPPSGALFCFEENYGKPPHATTDKPYGSLLSGPRHIIARAVLVLLLIISLASVVRMLTKLWTSAS